MYAQNNSSKSASISKLPHYRHRQFLANYILLAGNGVQAVYAAGYKQGYNSACVTASRLLRNAKVADALEKHASKAQMSADRVLEELSDVAGIETKLDGTQKLKALELLGKFHKLFTDKVETENITESSRKAVLSAGIQFAAKKQNISLEDAELGYQKSYSDKDDPNYSEAADPRLHPEEWPSGRCLLSKSSDSEPETISEVSQ